MIFVYIGGKNYISFVCQFAKEPESSAAYFYSILTTGSNDVPILAPIRCVNKTGGFPQIEEESRSKSKLPG
jgi:hypothetical protein